MTKHFTAEEQNAFYNSQTAKRVGAGAFLFNNAGELLLVKPSYKSGWSLVGGVGEANMSPMQNVLQEIHEEIGIMLHSDEMALVGIRYVSARDGRNEDMQVYFKAQLSEVACTSIVLQGDELEAFQFVSPDDIARYADTPRIQAVAAVLPAVITGEPFYIENETRIA